MPKLSVVPTLAEVLTAPGLERLTVLTRGGLERPVASVHLLDSINDLDGSAYDGLAILSAAGAAELGSYRFDIAVRRASAVGVTALASSLPASIPATSLAMADRGRISLVSMPADADLAAVIVAAGRAIAGGVEAAMARLDRCLAVVQEAEAARSEAAVLEAVRSLLPEAALRLQPGEEGSPVVVDGLVEETLGMPAGMASVVERAVLALGAGAIGRIRTAARRAEEAPVRSVAELLTELLAADPTRSPRLLDRARSLGLSIDGWHVVARIEVGDDASGRGAADAGAFELQETVASVALGKVRASGGAWHVARSESAVLLIRMWDEDPGSAAAGRITRAVERAVGAVREHLPGREVMGGIGSAHEGPTGLRASAAEARAAIGAARTARRTESVASYDLVGLRRMLVEWYASDTARDSVQSLLSPLETLGPKKAETAIRTLQVYLDEQGSVVRTARALYLHRNAVTYRIKRIAELLEVDLEDPDERLALQLACRARLLS